MPDEISNAELARRLDLIHNETHGDLGEIKTELGKLLPRELYNAWHQALVDRVARLEADAEAARSQRAADRRWLISAIVLPIVAIIVQILLTLQGPV